jgi:hypothetical protein
MPNTYYYHDWLFDLERINKYEFIFLELLTASTNALVRLVAYRSTSEEGYEYQRFIVEVSDNSELSIFLDTAKKWDFFEWKPMPETAVDILFFTEYYDIVAPLMDPKTWEPNLWHSLHGGLFVAAHRNIAIKEGDYPE